MILNKLGNTGIEVSRLCFGSLTMGPFQRDLTPAQGAELFECAFSHGVNFVDTAEIYGTYPHVREAARLKPDLVVCSKSYAYDRQGAEQSLKKALDGIGRDYIDVFLMHEQESEHTIRGHREALEYYLEMKRKGYIRAVGLSTHYVACMDGALKHPELEVLFPLINKKGFGIADGTADEMLERIRSASALGRGIIAMKPLGGGHLIGEREEALDYILSLDDCIDTIAIGMQSIDEVEYNCARFSGEAPDPELGDRLRQTKRRLLVQEWCEGCGVCVGACHNHALSIQNGRAVVDPDKCALCSYCARVCPQFTIKII
ncbi:MAG: aldo/keto reductase [Clostridia bacterium]|nr:aldo/keto reductase [Clostridia bacterium]